MQINQQNANPLERRIDMTVALADIDKDVENRLKKLARTVKMAGFRPGKVPLKLVAQQYGPQVRSEAIGEAVEKAFGEAVREQNLRVAGYPRIEPKQAQDENKLEFSAVFEVYPEIRLGDIGSTEIERPVLTVGDAEVDKTIDILRQQRATYTPVERAAAAGDRVVVDFTGRLDGEVFEGGQATDYPMMLGAGRMMLPEFEQAVSGMKAGESKTFDLTFPADYQAEHLAGRQVSFEVAVKRVEEARLPEVDADFARSLGIEDGDVEKMRAEVKSNLEREVKRRVQARIKDQAMKALLEVNPIEVPKALVEQETRHLAEAARQDLANRGVNVKDVPVQPEWFAEQAIRRVRLGLVIAELVKQKGLAATPEQLRAMIDEIAQSYEKPEEVVRWYYSQPRQLARVEALAIEENVVKWVVENAKATDKPVGFDELMGNAA
ncbi:MAG: trigger factor [Pseudomonadota bacterium]|jgi:trigger factor